MSVSDDPTLGRLARVLDDPAAALGWLCDLGHHAPERGVRDLWDLATRGLPRELLVRLLARLELLLPASADPAMALTNLDRFLAGAAGGRMAVTLAGEGRVAEVIVQLFSASQHFSEQVIREPILLDWLLLRPDRLDRNTLTLELLSELNAHEDSAAARVIRDFKAREMLRIGFADIVRGAPLELTTADLSNLAEACIEGAYRVARRRVAARFGDAVGADGKPTPFVVCALGKLGGMELNYSSDIDLIFLYDDEGTTGGSRPASHTDFFARVGSEIVRLLSDLTPQGRAYRVDMRLRPEGAQGPLARSLGATLGYYETSGRVWERQALIKARPVAGELQLGRAFLETIGPFIYRRYLSGVEIAEIKAMKRRIEARTASDGTDALEVKTGRGGIRDVEFVVQFLQLLHGGAYPQVREQNTLVALAKLERIGCLTVEERTVMEATYRFLRTVEHRLQTMFDRQIHEMPRDEDSLRALAVRVGYPHELGGLGRRHETARRFLADYRSKTESNREILNHLLHDCFGEDGGARTDPVVDLVLDPDPAPESVRSILGAYPFLDPEAAYRNLVALAREEIEFLSEARCRHFFAAIAPRLLQAVAQAPDPDLALTNLEKVSASLGAKAILWELFNFQPRTLQMYVELCSNSQFLAELLVGHPGMIDELMDSLVVDRPQSGAEIKAELADLCKGAEDPTPILRSFRNREWVRIGTRDILGRDTIREVTRELSDVAEAILTEVARAEWDRGVERSGAPRVGESGREARWAVVGLGKLGGSEMNYHSDVDLTFLYEAPGTTRGGSGRSTSNEEFFASLVRRVLRVLESSPDHRGPLYRADTRLRPHGASGPVAITLDAFRAYFDGPARAWERIALVRGRILYASGGYGDEVRRTLRDVLLRPIDRTDLAREVVVMRRKVHEGAKSANDLRDGPGGQRDIEFLVHYLQLARARQHPEIVRPNVWDALDALGDSGLIDPAQQRDLVAAYDFLRTVEGRLRIAHNRVGVPFPSDPITLARLAQRLGYSPGDPMGLADHFRRDLEHHTGRVREQFHRHVASILEVS